MKTSDMSPVASRVFTRLSPSEPPGRVSCLIVMLGLAAVKASITAFALATSVSVAPVRSVISVAPARLRRQRCRDFQRYTQRRTRCSPPLGPSARRRAGRHTEPHGTSRSGN